ncbi:hypothetical protein [Nocardioides convexus]|uniref:hypothetical protein n=1 Tax=Nocardioides convexus TaxID=2712224 RepID=UPI00241879AD|nr:hypothetical protein [Nocardioides convexus]
MDHRRHRLVRRAGLAVPDHDHPAPGDAAGEGDPPRQSRADRLAGPAGEVDATVPRTPHHVRRVEPGDDLGAGVQRPDADRVVARGGTGLARGSTSRTDRAGHEEQEGQEGEEAAHGAIVRRPGDVPAGTGERLWRTGWREAACGPLPA